VSNNNKKSRTLYKGMIVCYIIHRDIYIAKGKLRLYRIFAECSYSAPLRLADVLGLKLDTVAVAVLPEAVVTRIVYGATKAVPCVLKV